MEVLPVHRAPTGDRARRLDRGSCQHRAARGRTCHRAAHGPYAPDDLLAGRLLRRQANPARRASSMGSPSL